MGFNSGFKGLIKAIESVQLHKECTSHSHTRTVETLNLHPVAGQICCTMFEQDCPQDGTQCKMLLFKHSEEHLNVS